MSSKETEGDLPLPPPREQKMKLQMATLPPCLPLAEHNKETSRTSSIIGILLPGVYTCLSSTTIDLTTMTKFVNIK